MWGLDEKFKQKFGLYYSDYGKYKSAEFLDNKTFDELKTEIKDLKLNVSLRFVLNCLLFLLLLSLLLLAIFHIPVSNTLPQDANIAAHALAAFHNFFMKVENFIKFSINPVATMTLTIVFICTGLIGYVFMICKAITHVNESIATLADRLDIDLNSQIHLGAGKFYFSYGHEGITLNRHKGHLAILWGAVHSVETVTLSYGKKKNSDEDIKGQAVKIFLNPVEGTKKKEFIIIPAKEFYDSQYNAMSCEAFCAGLEHGIRHGNLENFSYVLPKKGISIVPCKSGKALNSSSESANQSA